jgi:hypothetical protein
MNPNKLIGAAVVATLYFAATHAHAAATPTAEEQNIISAFTNRHDFMVTFNKEMQKAFAAGNPPSSHCDMSYHEICAAHWEYKVSGQSREITTQVSGDGGIIFSITYKLNPNYELEITDGGLVSRTIWSDDMTKPPQYAVLPDAW